MEAKLFDALLESAKEAVAIKKGTKAASRVTTVEVPDVALLRSKTNLTQDAFAKRLKVSPKTLRNWEQGRRHPTGAALALLQVVEREPEAAMRALAD
ncbi:NadS family protein [Uliginosibacterium gangwonense]|uniref:NadS family protein n=1 Tax=Uliginosibacterium gangwonense TaxID=392736 RepID=UPI00037788FD|nr:NadS family protein [Uliginosibacterium gangwonense]